MSCRSQARPGTMGVITRVAGTGTAGNTGDDGFATDAQLNNPAGLAVSGDGGFLIADFGNHVVRKVSAGRVITRIAGSVPPGTAGMTAGPPMPNSRGPKASL